MYMYMYMYMQTIKVHYIMFNNIHPSLAGVQSTQWFGVDVGGTLVKAVYFETQDDTAQSSSSSSSGSGPGLKEGEGVAAMKRFLKSNLKYGSTGIRDHRLEMQNQTIGRETGTLHFIKFATSRMNGFFDMVTNNGLGRFPKVVCATGGGAFKFEKEFKEVSVITWERGVRLNINSKYGYQYYYCSSWFVNFFRLCIMF